MVNNAINGNLAQVEYQSDPHFKFLVPQSCPEVPAELLNPRNTWKDKEAYDKAAAELAQKFAKNFTKFSKVPNKVKQAGPQ